MRLTAIVILAFLGCLMFSDTSAFSGGPADTMLRLQTRIRDEDPSGGGQYRILYKTVEWDPNKTAIIICDMWNTMRCKIPADRAAEMAPHMNEFVAAARDRGVLIIHSPSGNVDFYDGTAARKRALDAP